MIIEIDSLASTIVAQCLLVIPLALVSVSSTIVAVEMVRSQIRSTSTALSYNLAYAIFGGTAPFVGVLLTEYVGKLGPAFYITALAAIALVIVFVAVPETLVRTADRSTDAALRAPV